MANDFDPYYKWLGIPPKDQPPNHYRLLGIELYEGDPDVIEAAANRLMTYLHEISTGELGDQAQKLLNEISAARICLLNEQRRAAYDAKLKSKKSASERQVQAVVRAASSRSHPAVPRVVSVENRKGAGAGRSRSLVLIGTAALLAFSAVVVTLLVVLNYDRGGGDVTQTDIGNSAPEKQAAQPTILELDWPLSERDGGQVLINGVSQPLANEAILEFPVRAGVNTVTVTRPGFVEFEETYPFARGEQIRISPRWVPIEEPVTGRRDPVVPEDGDDAEMEATATGNAGPGRSGLLADPPGVDRRTTIDPAEFVEEDTPNPLEDPPVTLSLPALQFGERPAFQDLMAIARTSNVDLRLVGGESVLGNSEAFQLTQEPLDDFRKAWVVNHIDRVSKRTPVARFVLSEDYLQFFWHTDCGLSQANLLRNCVLSISVDERKADLPLRSAEHSVALPLGGPKGFGKQTLAVEFLPSVSVLSLAVLRSDGPSVFTAELEQKAVAAGDSLSVDLGAADQGLPLVVQMSFTSTRVGAKKIVLNYVMQFQDTSGRLVTFERDNVRRELQLAQQQRLGAFDERLLEKLESNVLYYQALEKLTRLEEGEIRLHYRLFCDFGGQQVDLIVADQDTR